MNDTTLDPGLRSWVASANDPATDFPIQNLPLGMFLKTEGGEQHLVVGVAIGDRVVDIDMLLHGGMLDGEGADYEQALHMVHAAVHHGAPQLIMERPDAWTAVRRKIQDWLLDGPVGGQQARRVREKACLAMSDVKMVEPVAFPNYTDFYASIHHAANVGSMFRPDNALLPNYKHVPIGYHGRASSIVASGTPVHRPMGQTKPDGADAPVFGPSKRMDYELELGCVIARGNEMASPVKIADAPDCIFGFVLVNDWSARDIQAWEYQPLGPFLAKNFCTSVSPWIVTRDVIEPYRTTGPSRGPSDPQPLEYLRGADNWGLDIQLEVYLSSAKMRDAKMPPHRLSRGNPKEMYWTFPQMIAHHTSNGCNLMPGDLLASGTISGPDPDTRGCMLELTWVGNGPDGKQLPRKPLHLPTGETRTFLEDGDEVIFKGWCEKPGLRRIGFGECRGIVLPAKA
jgi:fumarylacetoacetase